MDLRDVHSIQATNRPFQWTLTTTDQLFTASGNHLYEGENVAQEDVNIETVSVSF